MRTFGTVVFGLLFMVAFLVFFAAHSVGGYPLSTDDVVDTARKADLRGMVLDAFDQGMLAAAAEHREHAAYVKPLTDGLREALREALPEEWFYDMLAKAHGGFIAFLEGGTDNVTIDLGGPKKKLRAFLESIASQVESRAPVDAAALRSEVDKVLDPIPDTANLSMLIARSGGDPKALKNNKQLNELREIVPKFKLARLIALGVLALLLVLIVLLAAKSPKRLLISVGCVLFLSGGLYVIGSKLGATALHEVMAEEQHQSDLTDPSKRFAAEAATKMVDHMIDGAFGRSNLAIYGITGLGFLMFVGGFFARGATADTRGPDAGQGRAQFGAPI